MGMEPGFWHVELGQLVSWTQREPVRGMLVDQHLQPERLSVRIPERTQPECQFDGARLEHVEHDLRRLSDRPYEVGVSVKRGLRWDDLVDRPALSEEPASLLDADVDKVSLLGHRRPR